MTRGTGVHGDWYETRKIIFEYICEVSKGISQGISQPIILEHIKNSKDIKGSSPGNQLNKLAETKVIVNIAPKSEKKHSGKANIWTLSNNSEAILRYMFDSFGADPGHLLQVFNQDVIQQQIVSFVKKRKEKNLRSYNFDPLYNSENDEDIIYPFLCSNEEHLKGIGALDEAMLVSPSLLRNTVTGYNTPEYFLTQYHFLTDLDILDYFLAIREPPPLIRYLSFLMLDILKYPSQVDRILDDLAREEVITYMKIAFPKDTFPKAVYPFEKMRRFNEYLNTAEGITFRQSRTT